MIAQLSEALDDLYFEKRVRAIILTGAGDAFSVGEDIAELRQRQEAPNAEQQWGEEAAEFRELLVRMLQVTKPIIAAVNGDALGAGATLVFASDIVVAGNAARIGLPEARYGLVAGLAAPLVAFRVGAGQAARMMLTGALLEAAEAHRIGLLHEVVPTEKVWARAAELAEQCAASAAEAIQLSKRMINESLGENLETQLSAGAIMRATSCTTEAAQEGIAALIEGRLPEWK
jgi:enoyl-CoA hydratase/carnithine racemase